MKTLNILLGSSDRAAINRIEALVRDLCFERALIECRKTALLDEFEKIGAHGWMDLIIFSPDNLLPSTVQNASQPVRTRSTASPSIPETLPQTTSQRVMAESLRAVQLIRNQKLIPIVAFGVSEQDKTQVLESGVDVALGALWESDQLKAELARILHLPLRIENHPSSNRWHLFGGLLRGFATAKSKV